MICDTNLFDIILCCFYFYFYIFSDDPLFLFEQFNNRAKSIYKLIKQNTYNNLNSKL
jgi:hypothetical protein